MMRLAISAALAGLATFVILRFTLPLLRRIRFRQCPWCPRRLPGGFAMLWHIETVHAREVHGGF
jgi:hypothetical protein